MVVHVILIQHLDCGVEFLVDSFRCLRSLLGCTLERIVNNI
jgi:hypothetical protein